MCAHFYDESTRILSVMSNHYYYYYYTFTLRPCSTDIWCVWMKSEINIKIRWNHLRTQTRCKRNSKVRERTTNIVFFFCFINCRVACQFGQSVSIEKVSSAQQKTAATQHYRKTKKKMKTTIYHFFRFSWGLLGVRRSNSDMHCTQQATLP